MQGDNVEYDAVVIGAGACGLMCAVQAGYLGKRVLVLEHTDQPGAKILISGGGRCNYTNLYATEANFISGNAHFCKSAFAQWTVADTLSFFETNGIFGEEKTLGQLFPSTNRAKDILRVFTDLCSDLGQEIRCNTVVDGVEKTAEGFTIYIKNSTSITTPKVVIATGGLPIPKMGATDFALRLAKQFNIAVTATAPALVPLVVGHQERDWYSKLSGTSIFARVSNSRASFDENILFTHWGLSGPAILQISSYWKQEETIVIDLLPDNNIKNLIEQERNSNGKKLLGNYLEKFYSKRFVEALAEKLPLSKQLAALSKVDMELCTQVIHEYVVKPAGDKGYEKAEVMRGGVSTDELSSKTLAAKKVAGLYFGGECVDVTGWLGGYNFQWAWASGYAIAQSL